MTVDKWIANMLWDADAKGNVVPNITVCIVTTQPWARVSAFLIPAGLVIWTV